MSELGLQAAVQSCVRIDQKKELEECRFRLVLFPCISRHHLLSILIQVVYSQQRTL